MRIAELSEKAKLRNMPTRTEGYKNYSQGQSIGSEIIFPRVRDIQLDEKVCRYSDESLRVKIKSFTQQMTKVVADCIFGAKATTANHVKGIEFLNP